MIFQTEGAIGKIVRGEKTQTRRIVKPHQLIGHDDSYVATYKVYGYHAIDCVGQPSYFNGHTERQVYVVGKTYAVQPGRTRPGVWWHPGRPEDGWYDSSHPPVGAPLRIRITAIRREDVRNISEDDARAEGYADTPHFWLVWCQMHDPKLYFPLEKPGRFADFVSRTVDELRAILKQRPAHLYDAWALEFSIA